MKIFLEQVVHWKECEGMGAVVTSLPHLKLKGDLRCWSWMVNGCNVICGKEAKEGTGGEQM